DMSYFQADVGFFTLVGKDETEESYYIFLRDDDDFSKDNLYIVTSKDVLTTDQLEQEMLTECKNCKLIRLTPAMIDEIPLWELTYIDEENRYVIEYKYLENGKTFEKLRLTRKYKKD